MFKKLPLLYLLLLLLPVSVFAQQETYFPNRLLIKYESPAQMQKLKTRLAIDPQSEIEQFLRASGARTIRPLLKRSVRQKLRHTTTPKARNLLQLREVIFNRNIDPVYLAAKVKRMPGVAYAEPKYIRQISATPNDPVLEKFIGFHRFGDAWDITTGSREVVIAIVDGGVNYLHPDLNDKLWVNRQEIPADIRPQVDRDADGSITSTEIRQYLENNNGDYDGQNGIRLDDALHPDSPFTNNSDDDDNGFTDDLFGWDFWNSGPASQPAEDNNPLAAATDHGTHVAGIAAAETDNERSVAGAGYNSTYMAIKAGGTADDQRSIGFGFEGIIYAAQQGADIINTSWGGGGFSQAEQDVIDFADELGSLVVASAGNSSAAQVEHPAAYSKVLSVGSVETSGAAASYSNYGYTLDVLATGTGIRSTSFGSGLATKSGTSMSAPVVSGLAALLKAIHPDWAPERIHRQIRSTADPVDGQNPGHFRHRLGHGSVNAFRALDTDNPGLKVIASRFLNGNGNKLQIEQPGLLNLRLVNVGAAASGTNLRLRSLINQGITIESPSQQLQSVANGDTLEVSFNLTINRSFDISRTPTFRLDFSSSGGSYSDFNIIQYDRFLYDVVDANRVKTSFSADGTVGFTDPNSGTGGVGFIPREQTANGYREGPNLLFEGGLMVEIDGRVYDAVRTEDGGLSRDFIPEEIFSTTTTETISDFDGHASFRLKQDTTRNVTIGLQTYAYNNPQLSNVVFLNYTLKNNSPYQVLKNVYLGLFNDWDIGNSSSNSATYLPSDSLIYLSEAAQNSRQPVAAVASLGPISGLLAIDNAIEGTRDSLSFGLYDGFTDTEKSRALKSEKIHVSVENTDASAVTASGPYTLNPGAEISVGFVYAFGKDKEELAGQITRARSQKPFEVSPAGRILADKKPTETRLFQNYPNPFGGKTQIYFDLSEPSHVTLAIYDILGRKVRILLNKELEAATHFVDFNAEGLSSGVYFARLKTGSDVRTIPMTFIK